MYRYFKYIYNISISHGLKGILLFIIKNAVNIFIITKILY